MDLAFMGLYEVMRDTALPHLWNVPAVAAIFSLEHLALNRFCVNGVGTLCFPSIHPLNRELQFMASVVHSP